jgi:hypothetical protein
MKCNVICKIVSLLLVLFAFGSNAVAQKVTNEKLIGCWEIKSIEFLQPMDDSVNMVNGIKGMIICFDINGKFITKIKKGGNIEIIGLGSFNIRPDGKTIDQKSTKNDGVVNESAEVLIRADQKLSFKVKEFIIHCERIKEK